MFFGALTASRKSQVAVNFPIATTQLVAMMSVKVAYPVADARLARSNVSRASCRGGGVYAPRTSRRSPLPVLREPVMLEGECPHSVFVARQDAVLSGAANCYIRATHETVRIRAW